MQFVFDTQKVAKMSMEKNFNLKTFAAKALVKEAMHRFPNMPPENLSPQFVMAVHPELLLTNRKFYTKMEQTIARAMVNMEEVFEESAYICHLVYKEAAVEIANKNSYFSATIEVFPGRNVLISIKTFVDTQNSTVELLMQVDNGYIHPFSLMRAVRGHKEELKLKGKLRSFKSMFQLYRPGDKNPIRTSFKPVHGSDITDQDLMLYIIRTFDESKRKLINYDYGNRTSERLEVYSISSPDLIRAPWYTCPCQSLFCPRYVVKSSILLLQHLTCSQHRNFQNIRIGILQLL